MRYFHFPAQVNRPSPLENTAGGTEVSISYMMVLSVIVSNVLRLA
jgi:hypothetical protein